MLVYKFVSDIMPEKIWYLKCPYDMTPEFLVIHNTAGDASAKNEIAFMHRNGTSVSFHYAVDDKEVRQGAPINRNTFHAGDGIYGSGNRKGIAIEICYSKSGGKKFDAAENNAAIFCAEFLKERGWGIDKIKKHQDFSGKYCPHRTLDLGWDRFLKKVSGYMTKELESVNDIVFELKSRNIITDTDLWINKLQQDENAYWLARKCVHYIRKAAV